MRLLAYFRTRLHHRRQNLPTHETLFTSRWLKPLAPWFDKPYFWHLNRRKAASAVAIGLFCGLMPGPTQMLCALLVAYVLRTNLALAVFTTLYTNPLTYLPLYYAAYHTGYLVLYGKMASMVMPLPVYSDNSQYWPQLVTWLSQFGKPLLLGVPILGMILATLGYTVTWWLWQWMVIHRRHKKQHSEQHTER